MLIEQIVELQLRGPGPPGLTCTSITGYFHDKTKIPKENFRVGFHLLLKCCTRQCSLLPPTWTKSRTIKLQHKNARCKTCFGLKLQLEGGLNNFIFLIGLMSKF